MSISEASNTKPRSESRSESASAAEPSIERDRDATIGLDPARREQLQRLVYREFLLEPELYIEAGLEDLPRRVGELLGCSSAEALERLTQQPNLEELTVEQLGRVLAIRDMRLVSRTAAAVAADLKEPGVSYDACVRTALCYAVAGMEAHVFSALRAAGAKRDDWARHHFIYGLMHAVSDNRERALWELEMALQREPYEEGRARIHMAISLLQQEQDDFEGP